MDAASPRHLMTVQALPDLADASFAVGRAAWWLVAHWYVPLFLALAAGALWELISRRLSELASRERCVLMVTPAPYFDPDEERVLRQGLKMLQAANALPWWAPKRSRSVRIRMRSDETHPLSYRLEGPEGAQKFLRVSAFGDAVAVQNMSPKDAERACEQAGDQRDFEVRGEMVLRGNPASYLREVPLNPDPLQPIVDAVSALKTELGDLVEICVDLQPAPRPAVRLQRWQLMQRARGEEHAEARAASRWMRQDVAAAADSLRTLAQGRNQGAAPLVVPHPRRVDRDKALGKLADDTALARVQILIRCASDREGRARALLAQVQGGFTVFAHEARLAPRGLRLFAWWWGPDQWPLRRSWQRRWDLGQCRPSSANLARLTELTGLLKPPTRHCRLPLLPAQLPTFEHGNADLLLQGALVESDGTRRLVATHAAQTLFETGLGKSGAGKTERALAQAIAVAHAGGGLLYVDPHGDSWHRAAPYLAHPMIMARVQVVDLKPADNTRPIAAWNLLDMSAGQPRHEVTDAVVDGLAAGMKWDDTSTPRGITILTACVQVLTALNAKACAAGRPEAQATVFHITALLTDRTFRTAALQAVRGELGDEASSWWDSVFPSLTYDAFGIVLNPLTRLSQNPVYHAFLGQPQGRLNLRRAMDTRRILWICTAGNGPNDRLVSSLIAHELLRAGRSRRDTAPDDRVDFRGYLDELITIAGSAPESVASMFEDLRKSKVFIHGMSQSLSRLPQAVREALLQNSSTLATTTGTRRVIKVMTEEWGERPSEDQVIALPLYEHYASFTVDGQRIGPVRISGIHLDDDFTHLARPQQVKTLNARAHRAAGGRPLPEAARAAATQLGAVRAFLTTLTPQASVDMTKGYRS
ncbi:ATP/GTP-binding protein [Streptomyces sp. SID14478]|uniref:ATP/GTP-binding protein n=1 Tax=Streptomyces sp. SID14478 TaxID=2706073 RepID=UPI0013DBC7C1|nr:ATP/GTP-binding protein [Streptomyces sp. SID14478]NEB78974.1 ATP/GTP-binding protein [Streptomyces sp. SID14478]